MESERFLTRPMSIMLDAVRFLCALGVMVVHAKEILGYSGPFPFTPRFSHNCVIMFFVLSGLMIDHSVRAKPMTLGSYAAARLARIMPVALPAMVLACLVYTLMVLAEGPLPVDFGWSLARSAFAGLTFLSQTDFLPTRILGDGAWWSLSYEVWYYVLFGAMVFLKGRTRLIAVPVLAVIAGNDVLALLPVWLAGVWLNRDARLLRFGRQSALAVLLACFGGVLFIATWDLDVLFRFRQAVPIDLQMSEWVVSDLPLAVVFVFALAALRPLAQAHAARLEAWQRPIRFAAGFSFTLYLFHGPLLEGMRLAGYAAGSSLGLLMLGMALVLAVTAGIARFTEGYAPVVRAWLDARFAGKGAAASRNADEVPGQSAALL